MSGWKTRAAVLALIVASPSVALAAGDGGHGPDWAELGSQIVNFCLYVALIVFVAKKPALAFFAARRENVVETMASSKRALEAAEAQLAETMKKIETLDAERDAVLSEFRELGEAERRRIVADAESEAARIVADAERGAERELKQAKATLERRMIDLALAKAETNIATQVAGGMQAKLIDNGIDALGAAS